MKTDRNNMEAPQFLSGWKEIANYLGKGVRTVQRYERELGLPVRRPAGKPRGSVVVTRAEIDAWVAASPIRAAFHLTRSDFPDTHRFTDSIKTGIAEMRRLHEQMMALRNEVTSSLKSLQDSVQGLQVKRLQPLPQHPGMLEIPRADALPNYVTPTLSHRKAS
jgi:predicted DNA-binding transcriptional regulator AlpA